MVRVHVKSTAFVTGLLTLVMAAGTWVSAQRGTAPAARAGAPSGAEIAAAARAGRLDHGNAATATLLGKAFKFTPVQATADKSSPEDGKGQFLGVLENGAVGDETGLPAGKYNLFFASVGGQQRCYAEANGQIVGEGLRTTATPAAAGSNARPRFEEKGWCVAVYGCRGSFQRDGSWGVSCLWRKTCF
jgi:hypothetical protein